MMDALQLTEVNDEVNEAIIDLELLRNELARANYGSANDQALALMSRLNKLNDLTREKC